MEQLLLAKRVIHFASLICYSVINMLIKVSNPEWLFWRRQYPSSISKITHTSNFPVNMNTETTRFLRQTGTLSISQFSKNLKIFLYFWCILPAAKWVSSFFPNHSCHPQHSLFLVNKTLEVRKGHKSSQGSFESQWSRYLTLGL